MKKLSEIVESIDFFKAIQEQKAQMKMQFEEALYFNYGQGIFKADIAYLTFISELIRIPVPFITMDVNDIPIKIKDSSAFVKKAWEIYHSAINQYSENYTQMQKIRSKEALIDD